MTLIWDRNQIHSKSKTVREWLATYPGVVAEDFPRYVPDLTRTRVSGGGPSTGGWPTWLRKTRMSCEIGWSMS
jgi:hypothetical protein